MKLNFIIQLQLYIISNLFLLSHKGINFPNKRHFLGGLFKGKNTKKFIDEDLRDWTEKIEPMIEKGEYDEFYFE
jgi:hypothetical protein